MTNAPLPAGCLVVFAAACLCVADVARSEPPPATFREPHRPQFHYTPQRNWMNDPNGLVYLDDEYHLFHQYNPHGDTWGHMSWAHAVSRDLVHWEHLPVALHEEAGVMIFSGSAVVDHHNTSGFGKDGTPPLVAIYTGHTPQEQTQHIAYSTDKGRTWTKFAGNPVIDENLKDFRDPKVIWHEPTKRWVMAVSLSDQRKVRFYGSKDLKTWQQLSEFGGQGVVDGIWECPDLFELPVAKADGTDSGRKRWVLVVNIGGGTPAGGSGVQYFVGAFDGTTFTNDNPKETKLFADYGPDFYAAQSFSDLPAEPKRRVWMGWMSNWRYAHVEPTKPWRTAQSLPRELMLVETANGIRLAQLPVRELAKLRAEKLAPPQFAEAGQQLELHIGFPGNASATLKVHDDGEHFTLIGHDAKRRELFVDRTKSRPGEPFHKDFPARYTAPITPGADGQIRLQILVDRSSVEVFGNGGLSVITASTFAPEKAIGWNVVDATDADGNDAPVSVRVWRLKSIWGRQQN
jgi:fructan beta-fructosidase